MAYEESLTRISLDSDDSLARYTGAPGYLGTTGPYWGRQFRFVKVVGDHEIGLCTANTDDAVGVLQNKPQKTGEAGAVGIFGVSYVHSGAKVDAGDSITCDGEGRGVKAAGGAKSYGKALIGCAAADQLIPVLLRVN